MEKMKKGVGTLKKKLKKELAYFSAKETSSRCCTALDYPRHRARRGGKKKGGPPTLLIHARLLTWKRKTESKRKVKTYPHP